jgi:hypothetical protein
MEQDIQACISTLQALLQDTTKLDEIPEDQRIALMAAAGRLSRPSRDEARVRAREIDLAKRKKIKSE